jgi:hypothetical protein
LKQDGVRANDHSSRRVRNFTRYLAHASLSLRRDRQNYYRREWPHFGMQDCARACCRRTARTRCIISPTVMRTFSPAEHSPRSRSALWRTVKKLCTYLENRSTSC